MGRLKLTGFLKMASQLCSTVLLEGLIYIDIAGGDWTSGQQRFVR